MTTTTFEGAFGTAVIEGNDKHNAFMADLAAPGGMKLDILNGNVEVIEVAEDVNFHTLEVLAASGHCAITHA